MKYTDRNEFFGAFIQVKHPGAKWAIEKVKGLTRQDLSTYTLVVNIDDKTFRSESVKGYDVRSLDIEDNAILLATLKIVEYGNN